MSSGGVTTHRIQRSIQQMFIGTALAQRRTLDQVRLLESREVDQQYKVNVSGTVSNDVAWQTVDITFREAFSVAHDRRDTSFTEPCMTYGAELKSGAAVISAHVVSWVKDDGDEVIRGAKVRIGAHAPGVQLPQRFAGVVHIVFEGYSAPEINEGELDPDG